MEETKVLNEVEVNEVEITEEPAKKNRFVAFIKKNAKYAAYMAASVAAGAVGDKFGLYKGFERLSTEEAAELVDAVSETVENVTEF